MKSSFLFSAFLLTLCGFFYSCSDHEEPASESLTKGEVNVYGMSFNLSSALLTQRNDNEVYQTVPYIWTHRYVNADGEEQNVKVEGVALDGEGVESSSFTLTLAENGIYYDSSVQDLAGNGLCMTIHFATAKGGRFPTGAYKGAATPSPGTFKAYYSTMYNTAAPNNTRIMPITKGTIEILSMTENHIALSFVMQTPMGTEVKGKYDGDLIKKDNRVQSLITGTDLQIYGNVDNVNAPIYSIANGQLVKNYSMKGFAQLESVLNLTGQKTQTPAQLAQAKELCDVVLVWDANKKLFRLMPPVKQPFSAQKFNFGTWKYEDKYVYFTAYTRFMKAPANFSESDYKNLDTQGVHFTMKEEIVEFASTESPYVFFQTVKGERGVIHFKSFTEPTVKIIPYGDNKHEYHIEYPGGYRIDYKVMAAPVVPQIG